ncbi:MAG TPA: rhodanese-like domain-containing protein [Novosphingobium sp.]|nr:rhodanese-like domain-containing protein [Novosphingobium sp.]
MVGSATPHEVHRAWKLGEEIALIDLREEFVFADGHPLFAACQPLSRLEIGIRDLIPRADTPIVLYGESDGQVNLAAGKLTALGYTDVRGLAGGLEGWREAGLELFADVNSPSKAFGELVEHQRGTPYVTALDLRERLDRNDNLVVLDARRFDEYQTMSIPTAVSVPGAELVLRAGDLAPDPATTIVVNCAGRTRSIIGAQSLINSGLPNPVMALRNGTIGWTLDELTLDYGQARTYAETPRERAAVRAQSARAVSYRAGVRVIRAADLAAAAPAGRTVYRFDVRSLDEHRAGHPAGFRHVPGGQLVQETDMNVPVRGARIILFDDRGARAHMTASWLAQMGWDVFVLEETGPALPLCSGDEPVQRIPAPACALISPQDLAAQSAVRRLILDLSSSTLHKKSHVAGARFIMRGRVSADLPKVDPATTIVLVSADDELARHAAPEVAVLTSAPVVVLEGGTRSWADAGLPLEQGMADALSPCEDVYRRPYEGTDNPREKMQAYLDWEYGLVDQLRRDASHGFHVI